MATIQQQQTGPGRTPAHIGTPVKVLRLQILENTGNLKAFADIAIGNLKIYGCRIVQQPGQRAWAAAPQREYMSDGQRRWAPIVEWPRDVGALIADACIEAYERERDAEVPF